MPTVYCILAPISFTNGLTVEASSLLMLTKTTEEWGALFEAAGVPSGPVYFIEELFENPQTLANGLVAELDHELLGHMRMVAPPFQMSESPLAPQGPSPVLGGDTTRVLLEAGYTPEEIDAMTAAGVIGVA